MFASFHLGCWESAWSQKEIVGQEKKGEIWSVRDADIIHWKLKTQDLPG